VQACSPKEALYKQKATELQTRWASGLPDPGEWDAQLRCVTDKELAQALSDTTWELRFEKFLSGVAGSLSLVWCVVVGLAMCAITLLMFHFAQSRFEILVVAAFVIIYTTVFGAYQALGYALARKSEVDLARYIAIARALNLGTEAEEQAQRENRLRKRRGVMVSRTVVAFNTVYYLIALVNLLSAIAS